MAHLQHTPCSWGQEPPYAAHVVYIGRLMIYIERRSRADNVPRWTDWLCPIVELDWNPD